VLLHADCPEGNLPRCSLSAFVSEPLYGSHEYLPYLPR
jgi:hypothetical protein